MGQLTDTSPEAEKVLIEVFRRMPMAAKWRQMGELFHIAKALHTAGERLRNPLATDLEIHEAWLAKVIEPETLARIKEWRRGRELAGTSGGDAHTG